MNSLSSGLVGFSRNVRGRGSQIMTRLSMELSSFSKSEYCCCIVGPLGQDLFDEKRLCDSGGPSLTHLHA